MARQEVLHSFVVKLLCQSPTLAIFRVECLRNQPLAALADLADPAVVTAP
jgi:hypothetical protein